MKNAGFSRIGDHVLIGGDYLITTNEAIRVARGLIGTSYETLDCINLIKKVIRTSAGGDKRYTTAHIRSVI